MITESANKEENDIAQSQKQNNLKPYNDLQTTSNKP